MNPLELPNLAAWYDLALPASTTSSDIRIDGSNRVSLIADRSGNSGTNALVANGATGSGAATTPSATANRFTGDMTLTVRCYAALSGSSVLVSKDDGGSARCFQLYLNNAQPVLFWTTGGTGATATFSSSSANLSYSAYQKFWLKVELDVDNGSGGNTTRFFHAADTGNNTEPTSWTQLGNALTNVGVTSVFDSASQPLAVGSQSAATGSTINGGILYASVRGNIGGAVSQFFDPSGSAKLATSVVNGGTTWTINSSGDLGARISGERDLVQLTASKQPIYLPWSGTNYGWLRGNAADRFTSPDSAAADITGDIELVARVSLDDWTPASDNTFIAKRTAGQWSYQFDVVSGGRFRLALTSDGSSAIVVNSSTANTLTDGQTYWVRINRTASTGTVRFFFAADQNTIPSSWTQLGTDVSGTSGNIWAGTAALEIGTTLGGTSSPLAGRVWYLELRNGIGGSAALIFNPSLYTSGTTFTASTGEVWTLNGGATIVNRTSLYFDGSDDYMKAAAFSLSQPETVYFTGQQVSWTDVDRIAEGGVSASAILQTGVSPRVGLASGAISPTTNDFTLQATGVLTSVFNGASSSIRVGRGAITTGNPGTAAPNGFTLAAQFDGTRSANIRTNEVCIYATAHDTSVQDRVIQYAGRKWGISGV